MEIWKDVFGYEGFYQVSNIGRIKSFYLNRLSKTMTLWKNKDGYLTVGLTKNMKQKQSLVHSLVALTFIDSTYKQKGLVVNHKNFKRDDNRLENIEVVTIRENANQKHLPSTSKYTGVCWKKNANMWVSSISINGKQKVLGYFYSEEEASKYYEDALICVKENRINDIKVKEVDKTSIYKGVYFQPISKRWASCIKANGKQIHLGYFDTEEDASLYYKNALCCVKEKRYSDIVVKRLKAKGYSFDKKNKKYMAYVLVNGKSKHLGRFVSKEDAIKAVNAYNNGKKM